MSAFRAKIRTPRPASLPSGQVGHFSKQPTTQDSAHIVKEWIQISREANDEHCNDDPPLSDVVVFKKQNKTNKNKETYSRKNKNNPSKRHWRVDKSLHFTEMM